ncbi:MAG: hypothetical protein ACLFPA_06980 [Dichotomicrobium sp.]
MRRIIWFLAVFAALAAAAAAHAQPRGDWQVLGQKRSSPGVESLTVDVGGRRAGRFDALKVAVRGGNILLLGVEVVYGNGERQEARIRTPITAGNETNRIDLEGRRGRFIRTVRLRYGSLGFLGRPKIAVLGHQVGRGRPGRGFRDLGPRWERVSAERVSRRREREVIQLSRRDGRFDAILLRVRQSPVRIRRVRVVYGNGRRQDFDLPNVLRRGQESDVLELRGRRGRFIDRIVLVYRDAGGPRRARVEAWARKAERRGGFRDLGPRWTRFSIERAGGRREREVIPLTRRDGRFDAVLLRVRQSPVRIRRLRVVFGNGRRQDLDLPNVIRRGQETGPLKLRGRRGRFIRRIVLVYRDAGDRRRARIEVWGRQARRR